MRIVEHSKILRLCRIGRSNVTGLHREIGLAQTPLCNQFGICRDCQLEPLPAGVVFVRSGVLSGARRGFFFFGRSLSFVIVDM